MTAADPERDQRVLQLFLAGATYSQIAGNIGIDATEVNAVVLRELNNSADRRSVLINEARAVYQERTEALFKAHWPAALRGDHKSAEICGRILDRQARNLPGGAEMVEVDAVDEISARRAARHAGPAPRASRAKG